MTLAMKPHVVRSAIRITVLLCILASAGVWGCLGSRGSAADSGRLTGILVITGNEPFTNLSLQTANGKVYIVQSDSTSLYKELHNLQGRKITVRYRPLPVRSDSSLITIEQYEIVTDL